MDSKERKLVSLPHDVLSGIKNNIRKGAADLDQPWPDAIVLTKKAYELLGIPTPTPRDEKLWEQYSHCLSYAVKQLARYRGLDGDWRITADMVQESLKRKFLVKFDDGENTNEYEVIANDVEEIIESLTSDNPNETIQSFVKEGVTYVTLYANSNKDLRCNFLLSEVIEA